MPAVTKVKPTYSLNAATTTATGSAITVVGADPQFPPVMVIEISGTSATVFIEANGGALDANGVPSSTGWVDVTGGSGYAMTAGQSPLCKILPPTMPYWRARISAINSASITAYVPLLNTRKGDQVAASSINVASVFSG